MPLLLLLLLLTGVFIISCCIVQLIKEADSRSERER